MVASLHAVREIELHVVAQIVETEFVIGPIRDVGAIGFPPFVIVQAVPDNTNAQAQKLIQPAHPLGVAPRQVIVDGYDVDAFAFEGIQICGKSSNQRLAFTGLHFRDTALMQDNSADELHVEMTHVENALTYFADDRESIRQQIFQGFSVFESLLEFGGLGVELFVGEA